MAQVDNLNYLPLLCWFIVLSVIVYFYLSLMIIPHYYTIMSGRSNYYNWIVSIFSYQLSQYRRNLKYMGSLNFELNSYLFSLLFSHTNIVLFS